MKIITKKLGEKYHKKKGVVKVRTGGCEWDLWKELGVAKSSHSVIPEKSHPRAGALCLGFLMVPYVFIISIKGRLNS